MGVQVLSGCNIIILANSEAVRESVFATLSIEGWQTNAEFPEDNASFQTSLLKDPNEAFVVILDTDGVRVQKSVESVLSRGFTPNRIILGCPPNSFAHRLLGRHGITLFPYSESKTPTGPSIQVEGLVNALLRVWKNTTSMLLDKEIKDAIEYGTLEMLASLTKLDSPGILKERAHLAYALGELMNMPLSMLRRTAKIALFANMVNSPDYRKIIIEARKLWEIKDLLECYATSVKGADRLPSDTPLELSVLAVTVFTQMNSHLSQEAFVQGYSILTGKLPLELRATLKTATSGCFQRVWKRGNIAS